MSDKNVRKILYVIADTAGNRDLCQQITNACRRHHIHNYDIVIHDCNTADFASAGNTSRGTQVRYNTAIDDAQVYVVISDIKPHYFAGYSNPIKNFVPGLCDYETARGNHSLAMDEKSRFCAHPWHLDPSRRQQPLAEDQLEAANLLIRGRPVWAMTTVSTDKQIQWADFGPVQETTANAFQIVDLWNCVEVCPASRVIISPGGYPNDIDLYICQRALELCAAAIADGGEVLFAAACQEGIGPAASMEHFWNILTLPIDRIESAVQGEYKLFSHKPLRFARLIRRLRRLWVYSGLQDRQVLAGHCQPTHDPQAVIDGWIRENPDVKIRVIDEANALALTKKLL